MTPEAFSSWLRRRSEPPAEIIPGVRRPDVAHGRLSDPDITVDEPPRMGGYGENRSDYATPLFAPDGEEPRTVHLGLDIFAAAGTPVFAPLPGRVQSFADNAQPGDYGPTIILQHDPERGVRFFTLYGHLARESIADLRVGQPVMAGERIGVLGGREVNGGWPPHLHLQVILDIGDWRGDFPGVCKASETARWLARCPDPRPLIGVA
jgi:peptidoglycan LD-endopeptidase LytH